MLSAVALAAFLGVCRHDSKGEFAIQCFAFIAALWVIYWIAIVLHELGHLIAGAVLGLRLHCLQLGWFYFCRQVYKVKPTANYGSVDMRPKKGSLTFHQYVWLTLGGPIISGIAAVCTLVYAFQFDLGGEHVSAWAWLAHGSVFMVGYVFLLSVLPHPELFNDLAHIQHAYRNRHNFATQQLVAEFFDNHSTSPTIENLEEFLEKKQLNQRQIEYAKLLSLWAYIDRKDIERAKVLAEELLMRESMNRQDRASAAFIAANIRGFYSKDPEGTAEAIDIYQKLSNSESTDKLHVAALKNANGEYEEALHLLNEGVDELLSGQSDEQTRESLTRSWSMVRESVEEDVRRQKEEHRGEQ